MHRIDGAGHVDNMFVPEDLATLRPPTEITPAILNAFQEELATFIEWAGLTLVKGDNTQLRQALLAKFAGLDSVATPAGVQGQAYTAFTTAGAAPNYTLTPAPAIAAYAAGLRFRVRFHAAGSGADTLAVSGLGSKGLKQYDSTGAKVAATIAANQLADVEYDGVDMVVLDPLPPTVQLPASIQGGVKNLKASATGTNATVSIAADEIAVEDGGNQYKTLRTVAAALNAASVGVNGLDTGVLAASTWYSMWVIHNPTTQATAGLLSLSETAPTLPAGYTHKARVGWIRTDGSANKYPLGFAQCGRRVQYFVTATGNVPAVRIMASGTAGDPAAPTWAAIGVSNYVPPTASKIHVILGMSGLDTQLIVAPNPHYGKYFSTTNPPPASCSSATGMTSSYTNLDMILESLNIYWAANGAAAVGCMGWEDNL